MSTALDEVRRSTDAARLEERGRVAELEHAVETLSESLADVQLALDDIGWRPLGEDIDATEIPLETVKNVSQTTRALVTINPLIKRGVAVRTTMIWGAGVKFQGIPDTDPLLTDPTNQKFIFSPEAQAELESCMATDGNLFVLVTKPKARQPVAKLTRVPMKQITGTVTDPENHEDIWFYRREWDVTGESLSTGQETVTRKIAYYPAIDYDERYNGKPSTVRGKPVIWESAILTNKSNKQVGWRWGTPDIMPVIFWTKAYKEFLENSASLVKAYSRYAFKVTAASKNGVQAASTKVAALPTRDPHTGEVQNVGATAVMGAGTTLQAIGRTGGSVDFKAGEPLAAMVAAGLEIPLTMLTADGGSANRSSAETLNGPTDKAMKARQQLWSGFFQRLFTYLGKPNVKIIWGRMDVGDIQRMVQAIAAALPLRVLHAEEIRDLLVSVLELPEGKELPTEEELGLGYDPNTQAAKDAAETAKQAALNPPPVVAGGAPAKPGTPAAKTRAGNKAKKNASQAPSYSDNTNRKSVGQHKYNQGRNG